MNGLDVLRQLGTQMRTETDPEIDVAARVIQRIRQERTSRIGPRLPLVSICVGASALLALAIVVAWTPVPHIDSFSSLSEAAVTNTGPEALLRVIEP